MIKFLLINLIRIYRWTIRPLLGQRCRFYPSCSRYCEQAIRTHGALKGFWLAVKRVGKCGPWHPGGVDELPE